MGCRLVTIVSITYSSPIQTMSDFERKGFPTSYVHSGLVVSALQGVWAGALASGIVLCSRRRQFALAVPLSTQVCKWVW